MQILTGTEVHDLKVNGIVKSVSTSAGMFETPNLIIAAGCWTPKLCNSIGVDIPLELSQHKVITLKTKEPYSKNWPIVKDLTTDDKIYFRHDSGGVVLVGTGDHGDPIEDPDGLTDHVDMDHVERFSRLLKQRMSSYGKAELL